MRETSSQLAQNRVTEYSRLQHDVHNVADPATIAQLPERFGALRARLDRERDELETEIYNNFNEVELGQSAEPEAEAVETEVGRE